MALGKIKEMINQKKEKKSEEIRKKEERRERMFSEKEEVELLFDWLSDKWKNLCLKLLAETQYVLARLSLSMDNEEEFAKIKRIVSIITYWHPWDKRDCLNKLCTKYNIEQTFSKSQRDAEDEDEEFEIMCENLAIEREEKKRRKEERKNEKQKEREEKKSRK